MDVTAELAKPIARELLRSDIPARLAYDGLDGVPRVIPIGFWWDGEHLVMATLPASAKVAALRRNPRVAITIDRMAPWPPRVLLIRGTARLELVGGVPEAYIEASRKVTPAEVFESWEQSVRALYEQMVVITVTPDWAKLLDFETTLPKAVEDLIRARSAGPA
ncbi:MULTISPECIES: pyridoxamine 5'-phosphate oxidase family protein [Amycolatopsis]|uniref:Pyridoxamine 5'-phosphate oxidase family protein n=1 Tax=Amycolatopsis thermalba TaxID=944492 RepID=A0ABY4NW90_9PSEU|nr:MULTISPECIES: pyridoxamine 5'-phosphate oxidase family protein [Amycolatopsis]OXM62850.1 pyridoxamine 5-phosphate oxidase [Amycolatopsis sp. KNN50.9b]UQS24303.1 pyridoxamine 5'-phosphate oxidase family protein [Amycolatopsis thermalba]